MIPLMLEEGYHANGWLGMLLGVRMWYAFCGSVLASEAAFEGKMEELCRELGDQGKTATAVTVSQQHLYGTPTITPIVRDQQRGESCSEYTYGCTRAVQRGSSFAAILSRLFRRRTAWLVLAVVFWSLLRWRQWRTQARRLVFS